MSREKILAIAVDDNCYSEASGSITMRRKTERGSGTGTMQTGTGTPKQEINSGQVVPVPQSRKSTMAKWYRYHTYWYRYQHVIFAGFE